ncbi:MAG TPA: 2-dehydropantoate 2-reductase, partial [Candidatus Thermoplasmatota archaeon]|nr:2-dehydropantoate 2-reductase [Candidatus Thermoplasmatota archaeon]
RRAGIVVEDRSTIHARPNALTDVRQAPTPDLLLVTVKAYDTAPAADAARPIVGPATRVLTLQNGLGNAEALRARFGDRVLAGVTSHGVTFVEPGRVRHAGSGYVRIGAPWGAPFDDVLDAFRGGGIEADRVDGVWGEIWAKVAVNVAINPATAITGLPNGEMLRAPGLAWVLEAAAEEAAAVAEAVGVTLPPDDLVVRAREVAQRTATNKSSMLQDVERGRRTEIDALCGEVVRLGREHAVPTPVNATLLALVKGIERTTIAG